MKFTFKILFVLLLITNGYRPARACAWIYSSLLDGTIIKTDGFSEWLAPRFYKNAPEVRKELREKLEESKRMYRKSHNIKDYNDMGVMLMYNGDYKKAQEIFQEIEAKKPGMYATAANLGTVSDLLDENQQAYHWIQRAIDINPASHHHSEWIHLKILEAKIKAEKDPTYYRAHNILGLNFGDGTIPIKNTTRDLHKTKEELYYQLSERMTFVQPKDPIIAQLLFDTGNIVAIINDTKSALDIYAQAREYGYSGELFDQREKYFQQLQAKANDKFKRERTLSLSDIAIISVILLVPLLIILGGIFFLIKKAKARRHVHDNDTTNLR